MIQIDPRSRMPIYEQLVDGITRLVVSGAMEADGAGAPRHTIQCPGKRALCKRRCGCTADEAGGKAA